jgi:menaquinone-9 beta-reductase
MTRTHVIIVGGGPAGSSCAWRLKRLGIDCLILERAEFPRVKLCAGWITPEVFADLETEPSEYPYGLITLKHLHISLRCFKFKLPTLQYSIRRYEFDHWLLRRSGAVVDKHAVGEIRGENGEFVIDDRYRCKYLIGAGGTGCPVRKLFFKDLKLRSGENLIVTQEEEFRYAWTDPKCYLWFMENGLPGYSWYVPKENGYLNIGVGGKAVGLKKQNDTIKRHWDMLTNKLEDRGLVCGYEYKPKGHSYYLRSDINPYHRGNVFLIGDAAGLATVDMGEGIGPAIRSGLRAADAIAKRNGYTLDDVSRRSIRWKWLRLLGK